MTFLKEKLEWFRNQFIDESDEFYDETIDEKFQENNPRLQVGALPARTIRPHELLIAKPNYYSDAKAIVNALHNGMVVIVLLKDVEKVTAAGIVDFIGGAVYLLNASMQLLNEEILLVTPPSVSLITDDLNPDDGISRWRNTL